MGESITVEKPQGQKPHDVLKGADLASQLPNGRKRMEGIFAVVAQQIAIDLDRAQQAASKEEAIAIFQATYDEYQKNKEAIIDKLDRLVTGG